MIPEEEGVSNRKRARLRESGYTYYIRRAMFANHDDLRAFSKEWIEDHTYEELERKVELGPKGEWDLLYNTPPTPSGRKQVIDFLEGRVDR